MVKGVFSSLMIVGQLDRLGILLEGITESFQTMTLELGLSFFQYFTCLVIAK
jgi:hypothetical protein